MWPSDKKFGDPALANDTILSETQSMAAKNFLVLVLQTHQAPVVWKLAQVQAAGPRYVRGPAYDILVLHFKCQPFSAGSYVFLYKVRTFRTNLHQPETHIYNVC